MISFTEQLKEILVRNNIVKPEDLDEALAEQKKNGGELSEILVKLGFITEDELTSLLSKALGPSLVDISHFKIGSEVVKIIPKDIADDCQVMPILKIGHNLILAMADPGNIFIIDNIRRSCACFKHFL